MSERVYPLNVDTAAELRLFTTKYHLEGDAHWRLARVCEKAQEAGYQAGYTRGLADGRHYASADLDQAQEQLGRQVDATMEQGYEAVAAELEKTAAVRRLTVALEQGHTTIAGLLGLFVNGERGSPGYEARRPGWMAQTELDRRCAALGEWRASWAEGDDES